MGPAYCIRTERLVIRCWNPIDAPLLKAAIDQSVEHLKPWMSWAHQEPESLQKKVDQLREFRGKFDLDQDYFYGIFSHDESVVIGATGLHTRVGTGAREIGYWIHKDYINQGFATESTAALVRIAFEVDGVSRVEIHCDPENVISASIPQKLKFTHEGILRKRKDFLGELRDVMVWTLLEEEYENNPAARVKIEAYDAVGNRIL